MDLVRDRVGVAELLDQWIPVFGLGALERRCEATSLLAIHYYSMCSYDSTS